MSATPTSSHLNLRLLTAAVMLSCVPVDSLLAHPGHEQEANQLAALREKVSALETSLVDSEKQITSLSESLAVANSEATDYRSHYERLRTQSEALGLAVLKGEGGLQERLIAALNEIKRLETAHQAVTKLLDTLYGAARETLNESDTSFPSAAPMAQALAAVEAHYQTESSKPNFAAQDVSNAKIIGMKADIGLIILNVGRDQGVQPGMPLQITREDQPIAPAIVVEVRDQICGAICQAPPNTFRQVQLGDGITIELSRP